MRGVITFFVCILLLGIGSFAAAQDAKALFDQGNDLFAAQKYEEASAKFKEAYALKPSWKLLYNIGQSEVAAKRYGLALDAFESYLSQAGDEISVERQQEVRSEADRLRDMVGTLDATAPKGDEVHVNGIKRGVAPIVGGILVPAGKRLQVEAVRDGSVVMAVEVKLRVGATISVDLTDKADAAPTFIATETGEEPEMTGADSSNQVKSPSKSLKIAGWVTLGLGVGTLGASVATGAMAASKENELKENCNGTCDESWSSTIEQRDNLAMTTTVLWAMGGAVTVAGVVLLVVAKKKSEAIALVPAIGPGLAGAQLRVRF